MEDTRTTQGFTGTLAHFFKVKFSNEIPNFLKIAPFATLPISQYEGFLLETSDFLVGRVLSFRLRLNMKVFIRVKYYKVFIMPKLSRL